MNGVQADVFFRRSRRAICTSAIISARSADSWRCRRATTASIASSTCMRSRCGRTRPSCRSATREVTAAFIACGIDPKKHIVFNQSQVAEHAELAWVFNCVARIGWLNRMTQFKEKAGKDRENASVGLYAYPNLMAADILAYRATHVPVGDDQKQHLELARDIAQKIQQQFHRLDPGGPSYGDAFFPLTEPLIQGPATRVMSLRDGSKKMSKSDPSGLFAHQPDRRRRRDRAKNPQGQDRPGAAAERGERPGEPCPRPTTWSAFTQRCVALQNRKCCANSAADSFPPSRPRWSMSRSPSSGRSVRK